MIRDIARWVTLLGVFLIPFLPLVVTNSLFFPYITGKNFLFRIIVEVIFASWAILAIADARYRPRFSYTLAGFVALLGVMAVANALGVSPHKSFWSNYERMDGYVTLVHLALYFVVAGSILNTERLWNAFWNTSIAVAVFMMFYGFCQLSGSQSCPIGQGGDVRIDSRMGNAAYLAIYMFFHTFIALLLLVRTRVTLLRVVYALLSVGFIYILIQTATRGTFLALIGGAVLAGLYIALFEKKFKKLRMIAIGAVVVVLALGGAFYSARDSAFVENNTVLNRLTNISLEDGAARFTIWKLALEGVKERPLLGWGQENFNYVFNNHYDAALYGQEPWFDRVHELILDWLIAGGVLGLLAYLSVLLSGVYYVVIRPFTHPLEEGLSVAERGILLGLLGGYTAHNLLVFDNLISYFLFASVLAMLHTKFSREIVRIKEWRVSDAILTQIVTPVVVVLLAVTIYMVNVPGLQAASDLIKGFQTQDPSARLKAFDLALSRGSFANQEIREQLVRITQEFYQQLPQLGQQMKAANPKLTDEELQKQLGAMRDAYVNRATAELEKQVAETPNDIRILIFQATLYRVLGDQERAIDILERARTLSPEKQQIYFEIGLANIDRREYDKAREAFRQAFDLEPNNVQARLYYAAAAIYTGDKALRDELITEDFRESYVTNETIIPRALIDTKEYKELERIFEARVLRNPKDRQLRVSLAWIQNADGRPEDAVATIKDAIAEINEPTFTTQAERYIKDLESGKVPN